MIDDSKRGPLSETERWALINALMETNTMTKIEAANISSLVALIDDEWYESVEGSYSAVPTWGPETAEVSNQIALSCPDGDIVSWDTRDTDENKHVYLRRTWYPGCTPEQRFTIVSHTDLMDQRAGA